MISGLCAALVFVGAIIFVLDMARLEKIIFLSATLAYILCVGIVIGIKSLNYFN